MIYKLLMKILKKNKELSILFAKEIVKENEILFVKEILADEKVYERMPWHNEELVSIENSILIDCNFSNCMIKSITANMMERTTFHNNNFGSEMKIIDKEERERKNEELSKDSFL